MTRGHPDLPEVALTFDDGPSIYTQHVLSVLQQYHVEATFFFIGQNVMQFPAYLQQALAQGNAIGNHTLTHPHLPSCSLKEIYEELRHTQTAVQNVVGICPTIFRPPYGEYNADVLTAANQLGLTTVIWSADAEDWHTPQPSAEQIAESILDAATNGAIFLLHEGGGNRENTVAALPFIIEGLQARGLKLVTVPQMLAHLSE